MKNGFSNRWFVLAVCFGAGLLALNGLIAWKLLNREFLREPERTVFFPGDGGMVGAGDTLTWIFPSPPVQPAEAPVVFAPFVAGNFLWTNDRTLTFTPSAPWPPCSNWRAGFKRGFRLSGGRTAPEQTFAFSSAPLSLENARQTAWSHGGRAEIALSFNAPVNAETLFSRLRIHYPGGEEIPWSALPPDSGKNLAIKVGPIREGTGNISLILRAGTPPAAGNLPLPAEVTREIPLAAGLEIESSRAYASLSDKYVEVRFSQPVDPSRIKAHLSIAPAMDFRVESSYWDSSGVRIRGEFLPNTIYTIRFDRDLKAENGTGPEDDLELTTCLPELKPAVDFADSGRYLTALGARRLRIESVNLDSFTIEARRIYPNNIAELVHQEQSSPWYWEARSKDDISSPARRREIRIPQALRNQVHRQWLNLAELTGENDRGIFALTLAAENVNDWEVSRKIVVVSDLGVSAHLLPGEALVRVASIREGNPIPGARVEIFNTPNQILASGETGADGCVRLELPSGEGLEPYLVTASGPDDFNFLALPGSRVSCGRKLSGPDFPPDPAQAFLYTDRGVYRPGETVHCRGLLRRADFSRPDPFPVRLKVLGPDGRLFREHPGFSGELAAVFGKFAFFINLVRK